MNLASWIALAVCVLFLAGLAWWLYRDWVRSRPPTNAITGGKVGIQWVHPKPKLDDREFLAMWERP